MFRNVLAGALALACAVLCAPAVASPTAEQAAQLNAARAALNALEATLDTPAPVPTPTPTPTPDPVPTPTPTPSPVSATWALDSTISAPAWTRVVAATVVKPGEVAEFTWTVTSANAMAHFGLISAAHNQADGNRNWPGGQDGSFGLRSTDGSIWNGSSKVGQGPAFSTGQLVMKVDRQANVLTFRTGSGAYSTPVSIAKLSGDVAPFFAVENGTAVVKLSRGASAPAPVPTPTPTPAPTPVAGKRNGVSVYNVGSAAAVQDFMAKALGGQKPWIVWANASDVSDQAERDSLGGGLSGVYNPARWAIDNGVNLHYTIPILTANGAAGRATTADWQAAVNGAKDAQWRALATALAQAVAGKPITVIVRPWSEGNGNWFFYSIVPGQEQLAATAFARYVNVFREAAKPYGVALKFDFNVQLAQDYGVDIWKAYPGDPYADYITGDAYYLTARGHTKDQAAAFAMYDKASCPSLTSCKNVGLRDLSAKAKAHGKETGLAEWGVDCNCADYIKRMGAWLAANGGPMNIYWNTPEDPAPPNTTVITDGSKPDALAAYRSAIVP